MCLCVHPEDHVCRWCKGTNTEHRENKVGQFVCSELCRVASNAAIEAFYRLDVRDLEDLEGKLFPDQES